MDKYTEDFVSNFIAKSKALNGPDTFDYSLIIGDAWPDSLVIQCTKVGHTYVCDRITHEQVGSGCYKCLRLKDDADLKIKKFVECSKVRHGIFTFEYSHILKNWPKQITVKCIKHGHCTTSTRIKHMESTPGCHECHMMSPGYIPIKNPMDKSLRGIEYDGSKINEFIRMSTQKYGKDAFDYSTISFEGTGPKCIVRFRCLMGHDIETRMRYHIDCRTKCYECGERRKPPNKYTRTVTSLAPLINPDTNPIINFDLSIAQVEDLATIVEIPEQPDPFLQDFGFDPAI